VAISYFSNVLPVCVLPVDASMIKTAKTRQKLTLTASIVTSFLVFCDVMYESPLVMAQPTDRHSHAIWVTDGDSYMTSH